jgi:hypothetical protein
VRSAGGEGIRRLCRRPLAGGGSSSLPNDAAPPGASRGHCTRSEPDFLSSFSSVLWHTPSLPGTHAFLHPGGYRPQHTTRPAGETRGGYTKAPIHNHATAAQPAVLRASNLSFILSLFPPGCDLQTSQAATAPICTTDRNPGQPFSPSPAQPHTFPSPGQTPLYPTPNTTAFPSPCGAAGSRALSIHPSSPQRPLFCALLPHIQPPMTINQSIPHLPVPFRRPRNVAPGEGRCTLQCAYCRVRRIMPRSLTTSGQGAE